MTESKLQYSNLDAPVPLDFPAEVTQLSSAPAGVPQYISFFPNPLMPSYSKTERTTPSTENDILYNMYIDDADASGNATTVIDGALKFFVNDIDTGIVWAPLSSTNLNLRNKRPNPSPVIVNYNQKLEVMFIPSDPNTSVNTITQKIRFNYLRVPLSYKKPVHIPE